MKQASKEKLKKMEPCATKITDGLKDLKEQELELHKLHRQYIDSGFSTPAANLKLYADDIEDSMLRKPE